MSLTPNERPINNHLDAIIDRWASSPAPEEAKALARAERVALYYIKLMQPSPRRYT